MSIAVSGGTDKGYSFSGETGTTGLVREETGELGLAVASESICLVGGNTWSFKPETVERFGSEADLFVVGSLGCSAGHGLSFSDDGVSKSWAVAVDMEGYSLGQILTWKNSYTLQASSMNDDGSSITCTKGLRIPYDSALKLGGNSLFSFSEYGLIVGSGLQIFSSTFRILSTSMTANGVVTASSTISSDSYIFSSDCRISYSSDDSCVLIEGSIGTSSLQLGSEVTLNGDLVLDGAHNAIFDTVQIDGELIIEAGTPNISLYGDGSTSIYIGKGSALITIDAEQAAFDTDSASVPHSFLNDIYSYKFYLNSSTSTFRTDLLEMSWNGSEMVFGTHGQFLFSSAGAQIRLSTGVQFVTLDAGAAYPDSCEVGDVSASLDDYSYRLILYIPKGAGDQLYLNTAGEVGVPTSTIKAKENIARLEFDPFKVLELQPRRFTWKRNGKKSFGLIAEEVNEVLPQLVNYRNGEISSVKYDWISVLYIPVLKNLFGRLEQLESSFVFSGDAVPFDPAAHMADLRDLRIKTDQSKQELSKMLEEGEALGEELAQLEAAVFN